MQVPFILITYGFSQKVFVFEQDGVVNLPIFSDPVLASLFIKSTKETMQDLLQDKEDLQTQVCSEVNHAINMFQAIGIITPNITIIFNAPPIDEDPQLAISKVAQHLTSAATTINKHYDLEELGEALAELSDSPSNTPKPSDS